RNLARRSRPMHDQLDGRICLAVIRDVDGSSWLRVQPVISNAIRHPDHFGGMVGLPFPKQNRPADRVFPRPEKIGYRPADNHAQRLPVAILLSESPALEK